MTERLNGTWSLTIAVCVYNGARHLRTPTWSNLVRNLPETTEILFLDDGSTDESLLVMQTYARSNAQVRLIHTSTNRGAGVARRELLRASRGHYVWFADCDDVPHLDAALRAIATSGEADVILARGRSVNDKRSWSSYIDDVGEFLSPEQAIDMLLVGTLSGYLWNKLLRRDALLELDFPKIRTQEDICIIAAALCAAETVSVTTESVYDHVHHTASTMHDRPQFQNLVASATFVIEQARHRISTARLGIVEDQFLIRHVAAAASTLAIYAGSDRAARREGQALARSTMRGIKWRDLASRRDFRHPGWLVLKASPAFYTFTVSMARRARQALHGLRHALLRKSGENK